MATRIPVDRRNLRPLRNLACGIVFLGVVSGCGAPHPTPVACGSGDGSALAASDVLHAPAWPMAVVASIGQADPGTDAGFGSIGDIDVSSEGRLFVADRMEKQIRVFEEGRLVGAIGRPGQGPGEFEVPAYMRVTAGDTLRVFDTALWRISVFSPEGHLVATDAPPRPPQFGQIPELAFTARGTLVLLGYAGFQHALDEAMGSRRSAVVRSISELATWTPGQASWQTAVEVPSREVFVNRDQRSLANAPFGRRPLWTVSGADELWYADSGEYSLQRISLGGDVICAITVAFERGRITETARTAFFEGRDGAHLRSDQLQRLRANRKNLPMPRYAPALGQVLAAAEGELWVNPISADDPTAVAPEWHILSEGGAPLGTTILPEGFTPRRIRDGRIYGVQRDADNVETVAVLEVQREPAS